MSSPNTRRWLMLPKSNPNVYQSSLKALVPASNTSFKMVSLLALKLAIASLINYFGFLSFSMVSSVIYFISSMFLDSMQPLSIMESRSVKTFRASLATASQSLALISLSSVNKSSRRPVDFTQSKSTLASGSLKYPTTKPVTISPAYSGVRV